MTMNYQAIDIMEVARQQYKFEDVEVRIPELQVLFCGKIIHVTLLELRLLMIFLEQPYKQISSDELIQRVDLTGPDALRTLISSVRSRLDQKYIHSCRGYGYAFTRQSR